MTEHDEAEIKVVVQEYINEKLVLKETCIERHKEVSALKDDIREIKGWLKTVMILVIVQLFGLIGFLAERVIR